MGDPSEPGTLLNLAAVARMMLADGRVAPEELEVFDDLLDSADLDEEARGRVEGWTAAAPDRAALVELADGVDEDGRREALALGWVVALADGEVDPAEVATLSAVAGALGLAGVEQAVRAGVEASFYGAALSVLSAAALMVHAGGDSAEPSPKRLKFAELLGDMELPSDLAERARDLLVHTRPVHAVLGETALLAPDFQEALLGNLWALAWADGAVDESERALFARFEKACGVARERVLELQLEWGPAGR